MVVSKLHFLEKQGAALSLVLSRARSSIDLDEIFPRTHFSASRARLCEIVFPSGVITPRNYPTVFWRNVGHCQEPLSCRNTGEFTSLYYCAALQNRSLSAPIVNHWSPTDLLCCHVPQVNSPGVVFTASLGCLQIRGMYSTVPEVIERAQNLG